MKNNSNQKKTNKANNPTAKNNAPEMKNGLANENLKSDNNTTAADSQDM